MSTIAYRAGVLACDTLIMDQGGSKIGHAVKVWHLADGRLYGGVGSYGDVLAVRDWIEAGMNPENQPETDDDFYAIIVLSDSTFIMIEDRLTPVVFKAEYTALGTGKSIALGAMAHGADAVRAVEAAIKHDTHSGGGVEAISLRVATVV